MANDKRQPITTQQFGIKRPRFPTVIISIQYVLHATSRTEEEGKSLSPRTEKKAPPRDSQAGVGGDGRMGDSSPLRFGAPQVPKLDAKRRGGRGREGEPRGPALLLRLPIIAAYEHCGAGLLRHHGRSHSAQTCFPFLTFLSFCIQCVVAVCSFLIEYFYMLLPFFSPTLP